LEQPEPYKQFLGLLSNSQSPEDPIPIFSATFLTNLVAISLMSSSKPIPRDDEALPKLYAYLSTLAKCQDSGLQDIGVQQFSTLLRTKRAKELFWKQKKDTVDPMFEILRTAAGAAKDSDSTLYSGATSIRSADSRFGGGVGLQLTYHVLLVLWQLSFEGKMVGEGLEKYVLDHCSS
jgi:V-type H+-transporting ATPase subunit H